MSTELTPEERATLEQTLDRSVDSETEAKVANDPELRKMLKDTLIYRRRITIHKRTMAIYVMGFIFFVLSVVFSLLSMYTYWFAILWGLGLSMLIFGNILPKYVWKMPSEPVT